jgi:hypothetical protein
MDPTSINNLIQQQEKGQGLGSDGRELGKDSQDNNNNKT